MRVVQLDRGVVSQSAHVLMLLDVAADEVEERRRGEEILLPEAKFLASGGCVARIEHLRDRLSAHRIRQGADEITGVESVELERIRRTGRPQAERVHVLAAPADYRRVVADRLDGFGRMPDVPGPLVFALDHFDPAAEADGVVDLWPLELPGVAVGEPVFGRLLLPAAANDLAEQTVVVADAVAVRGDAERRHAVHETGGEASEAAVAERGVRFDAAELGQIDAELLERLGHRFRDTEIGHRVEQKTADQEFQRQVVDPFTPVSIDFGGGFKPAIDDNVSCGEGDCEKPVARAGHLRNLAHGIGQLRQHSRLEFGGGVGLAQFRLRRCPLG